MNANHNKKSVLKIIIVTLVMCSILFINACSSVLSKNNSKEPLQKPEVMKYEELERNLNKKDIVTTSSLMTVDNKEFVIVNGELKEYMGQSEIIDIPDSVKRIGNYAFSKCDFIKSVTIPNSVTAIGREAFYQCSNLSDISIPDTVTDIGAFAFTDTPWLKEKQEKDPLVIINDIVIDGKTCTGAVIIPDYITKIGDYAFSYIYIDLNQLYINHYVRTNYPEQCLDVYPEEQCLITSITFPDSITDIGAYAFAACPNLTKVVIPASVTRIGEGAFHLDYHLLKITLPNSVTQIGTFAFSDTAWLTEKTKKNPLVILNNVVIDASTCKGHVTIPDGVTSIGDYAFVELAHNDDNNIECSSKVTDITIPNSVTSIGNYAFWSCDELSHISIPSSVKSIGDFAFSDCTKINGINIPKSVKRIGNWAFHGCSKLTDITIPKSVDSIGDNTFSNTPWLEAQKKKNAFVVINNILINGDSLRGDVNILDTITSISGYAFFNSTSISRISFPKSITVISDHVCFECNELRSVYLPDTITSIEAGAFSECYELTDMILPASLTNIGNYAFYFCESLKKISIPDSVTSIGKYAFCYCKGLEEVSIPDSITSIGEGAFLQTPNITIIGSKNSYAERYANANNIRFKVKQSQSSYQSYPIKPCRDVHFSN